MKFILIFIVIFSLSSCGGENTEEINLSQYFKGVGGTAVFYNPAAAKYKIYNTPLSHIQASPCSTFKIMSAYIALSENLLTPNSSGIEWNGKNYGNPVWNKKMDLPEAFKTSCVWYFRELINKVSPKTIKSYLQKYNYGNQDVSDWRGNQNDNTNISELKGFWIESSLQISPLEQVRFLAHLFSTENQTTKILKDIMLITDNPVKIYGKTGLGIKNNMVDTAWFIGFYEQNNQKIFFAVRLNDNENRLKDYRHLASAYAKQIALDIIQNAKPLFLPTILPYGF